MSPGCLAGPTIMRLGLSVASVLLLAGCLSAPTPGNGSLAATGGWALDCTLGSYERAANASWAQACEARASHTPGPKQEVWIAVNPTNVENVVVGAKDTNPDDSAQCVWNGVFVTHDGGRTWKDNVIGGPYANRTPDSPYFGYACNTDPMMAFSADGALHYVVEMYNFEGQNSHGPLGPDPQFDRPLLLPGWKLVLATSHDGGDTWPDAVTLDVADGVAAINDYSRITVSPKTGTILTAINEFSGGPFFASGGAYTVCNVIASRDGGKSAALPVKVPGAPDPGNPTTNPANEGCQVIAAAPDGTIILGQAGSPTHWWVSTDDGQSFQGPTDGFSYTPIVGQFNESKYRTGTNFEVAYDKTDGPNRGTLYCVYADGSSGNADIDVRSSKDNGKTWGNATRVNDDNGTHNQFIPNIAVAGDGSVHAFFMDKRWDPANKLIDITHAWSLDGGRTWRNERVTNVSWDGDLGRHQEGFPFIGDYIGVAAVGDDVWAGVPDASNGQVTVIAAAHVHRAA